MAEETDFVIEDDNDVIMDFEEEGVVNLGSEEEDSEESIPEPQEVPQTEEEKISWHEQIRMIHLRSHLNQLAEKVKHTSYVCDKTREELRKCRANFHHLESERDSTFQQVQQLESDGNQAAVYRVRATHQRLCEELEEEQKLETKIRERLDQAEYDLAVAQVEHGKFILIEDELIQQEQRLARCKTRATLHRLTNEHNLVKQACKLKLKESRCRVQTVEEQESRHRQALEEADRNHQRASKYLHRTLGKMRQRQQAAEDKYQAEMQRKMDMLVKLKADINCNKENLKAIRARDKAAESVRTQAEEEEYQAIVQAGGNADQMFLVKKRQTEQAQKQQQHEIQQVQGQVEIISRILNEEQRMKKRKKQQPQFWSDPQWEQSLRVQPYKTKPIKLLKDYLKSTTGSVISMKKAGDEKEKQDEEKTFADDYILPGQSTESGVEINELEVEDLAKPEFEGLWEEHKPYKVPTDTESSLRPPGASKMEKEILQKTLEKHRKGIIVKQVAAGREFSGCPFYSKPDLIHFKDFDVGSTYKQRVLLTNVSYSINYCKFLDITERLKDFIKIDFNPPGQMSAGMSCEMLVTFKPMINEDLAGEVNFLSQIGPFSVPLKCSIKRCNLELDTKLIDFGSAVVGQHMKRSFTLTNTGALGTSFEFFKVTGVKRGMLMSPETSLSTASIHVQEASVHDLESGEKLLENSTSDKGSTTKKQGQEDLGPILEIVDEAETGKKQQGEESQLTVTNLKAEEETLFEAHRGSVQKTALDVNAVASELESGGHEDHNLDGMHVGTLAKGEIRPFSSVTLDITWHPTIPGKVDSEFMVTFADPLSEGLSVHAVACAIDVPVWVDRQTVDLKICMFNRLYQDSVIVHNRATSALRVKFEVCSELKNHMEILPKTGYIQAQSQFAAQLKFLPQKSLFEEAQQYFDRETGVLEVPMLIRVAEQVTLVPFTVCAVVTNSDLEFDVQAIDFGYCTVYESVSTAIRLTNKSILPQEFGFVGLPEYVEVQPNDGFGTLLPLETIEMLVLFSPTKTSDFKFQLVCKSLINREFKIDCKGVGVLPPLKLSHQMVHFAATALYDISTTRIYVLNDHTSSNEFSHPVPRIGTQGDICPVGPTSFEFVVPEGIPLNISPLVGTVKPGKKAGVQLRFTPVLSDEEIRQEAVNLAVKMEAARAAKAHEEALRREKELAEEAQKAAAKGGKAQKAAQGKGKGSKQIGAHTSHAGFSSESKPVTASPPDPSTITTDSPEYKAATTSLLRQFQGSFSTVVIPCYVTPGATGRPGELPYSIHNTLYVEVHCPVVKPQLVVLSDNGNNMVNFGEVSIGQHAIRSITIQNIADKTLELSSSILDTGGPFLMLNAMRVMPPGATHTMIISFTPNKGRIFLEALAIRTDTSALHLTLRGQGVSPIVNLSVENNLLDMGAVLVSDFCEKIFKIQNTSSLAIDYVIKLDSLSPLRYKKAQALPHFLHPDASIKNFVGTQNFNGKNVFDFVPAEGTIRAGETKEITVTFAPDHESANYSDGVHIELFSEGERHFFQVKGQGRLHLMFLEGGDPLYPDIQSLGIGSVVTEQEQDIKVPPPIPMLVSVKGHMKDEVFQPATRDIFVCCIKTMAISHKKNGDFQFENLHLLNQKGFSIEPQKATVEAGCRKAITISWTPPPAYDPNKTVEESVLVTLRGDVTEQYQLMLHAMVVSE